MTEETKNKTIHLRTTENGMYLEQQHPHDVQQGGGHGDGSEGVNVVYHW